MFKSRHKTETKLQTEVLGSEHHAPHTRQLTWTEEHTARANSDPHTYQDKTIQEFQGSDTKPRIN